MLLPNQHIVQRGWQILTPHEDKDDDCDDGDGDDDDDYDIIIIIIMTIVSVEQRPGWGAHVFSYNY